MIQKILKLSSILLVCSTTLSCAGFVDDRTYEERRDEAYKTFPRRDDNWFSSKDKFDPYGDLSRADYKNLTDNSDNLNRASAGNLVSPTIQMPEVTNLLAEPEEQNLVNDRLVSISVNENVPLKDVLVELARRAEVDIEVDPAIDGSIIFIAKDKPFSKVIARISQMAGLTYSFDDGVLKIAKDKPVVKNYKFNLLDLTRSSSSSVNTSFSLGSSGSSAGGGTVSGGSNAALTSKSGDGDIWKNIADGVTQILTISAPVTATTTTPTPAPITGGGVAAVAGGSGVISTNKNAGVISVMASEKQHRIVKEYLDRVHMELTSQVLIEARVVEVTLKDEFKSGINWNMLTDNLGASGGFGAATPSLTRASTNAGLKISALPVSLFGDDNSTIDASVEFLQTFGTTRSLSNPRVNALNNQFAVLNFSQNNVYFEVDIETTDAVVTGGTITTPAKTTVNSTIKSTPIGAVLTLQPSIDLGKNEILMNVKPTLTRLKGTVQDPALQIAAEQADLSLADLNADIPVVDTRELDTTLRIKNGEVMVIGGLLEEKSNNTDAGLPGFSEMPYIGNAFKSVTKDTENIETVIFIKATIVAGQGVSIEDEEFYKKFTTTRSKFIPN